MEFIKKHYEKVVLSIVLLGLAVAAALLPYQVSRERDRLEEIEGNLTVKVRAKPFKPLDEWLSTNKSVVARIERPLDFVLAGEHNLFNPVPWKKLPNGGLVPVRTGAELGPGALKIAQIRELQLMVSFEGVVPGAGQGEPTKYQVMIRRETEHNPRPNSRTTSTATPRNDLFELLNVQGPPEDPTGLVLKLKDDFEPILITKDKPYSRVVGYAADLVYPPGKQEIKNKRTGDQVRLEDDPEVYKIVAITRNEVVISADSTKKRTVIKDNASSTTASAN